MAITNFLAQAGGIFDVLWIVLLASSPIILIAGLFLYKKKLERYPIEAVIIERRGENLIKSNDRLGKFTEYGIHKYKLKKAKDTIPILDYRWVLHSGFKPTNFFEKISTIFQPTQGTAFLFKYGSKQYKPIPVNTPTGEIKKYEEVMGKNGEPVVIEVYKQVNPHERLSDVKFEVIDWDNINFMVQEQRATDERRRKKENWLAKHAVPIAMVAGAVLVFIFAIYFASQLFREGASAAMSGGQPQVRQEAQPVNIPVISDAMTPGK